MSSKSTLQLSEVVDGLRDDILWMLITFYAFSTKAERIDVGTMSRSEFVLELNLIESAQRDLVMRLTALDDGTKNRSFQRVKKLRLQERLTADEQKEVANVVAEYRRVINDLKVNHRNEYIAHVDNESDVSPRLMGGVPNIGEVVVAAVRTFDQLIGQRVNYTLRVGSQEPVIDLREALGV